MTSKPYSDLRLKISLLLGLLLFATMARRGFGQENTSKDSATPLVYSVENTGAKHAAPTFPTFDQLPIIHPLPDPFRFANGKRDTSLASWERRRNEIKAAIEKYEIGPKPDCSDCSITASYVPPSPEAQDAKGVLTVVVTRKGKSLTLTSGVYVPHDQGSGPFPALIVMTFRPQPTGVDAGTLPSDVITSRPIATIDFVHNQVAKVSFGVTDHSTDPFYQLYPELCAGTCNGKVSNSGLYAAWSWGASRLIDGIEIASHQATNPLPIDVKHLATAGCSYAGKMALFAGAFDERVALVIAQENGGGGAASWRVSHAIEANGSVEDIHDTSYDWFGGQMREFALDNGYKLPTDHDELMAMVAPRALLETGNTDYYWLSNRSNYISARATQQVYNTFGIGDRFGFYIDGGHQHCQTLPAEAPAIAAYLDKFLLGDANANTDVEVNQYPSLDYSRWTAWWGTSDPKFPNDWNPGDGSLIMSTTRSVNINSGDTVSAGYQLSIPGGHAASTISVAGANVETDVSCPNGSSYTLTIPLSDQSLPIPANDNSWLPSLDQKSPLVNQGSAKASTCSGGTAKGAYFSVLGLANGTGKPPKAPGFVTDTAKSVNVRFQCTDEKTATGGSWSPSATVNHNPK